MSDFLSKFLFPEDFYNKFTQGLELPKMVKVRQSFPDDEIVDIESALMEQIANSGLQDKIKKDARVALCVGSRGVANIGLITKKTVEWVKSLGAQPFIVPAMGSHGGATNEGQAEILEEFGITQSAMGAPVISNLDTTVVDTVKGIPVHVADDVLKADACIILCRIKPHTAFRGEYESGLMKMLAIGVGKHNGAMAVHRAGFGVFRECIPLIGQSIIDNAPIIGGIATIENAFYKTAKVVAMQASEFMEKEPALLQEAFKYMGQIYFNDLDVLIVDEIGKNFSGSGMDPNITGTFVLPYASGGVSARARIVFGISKESHGSGIGMGVVDFTTLKALEAYDPLPTYANAMTSGNFAPAKLPLIMGSEKHAMHMALYKSLGEDTTKEFDIVHIENTEQVEYITISESLYKKYANDERIEQVSEPFYYEFDEKGNLIR